MVGVYGDGTGQSLNIAAAVIEMEKLPFPVALAGGLADDWGFGLVERGRFRAAAAYGVEPYGPHGVLIDRTGVVRGRWQPDENGGDGLLEVDVNDNALREALAGPLLPLRGGKVLLPDAPGLGYRPDLGGVRDLETLSFDLAIGA